MDYLAPVNKKYYDIENAFIGLPFIDLTSHTSFKKDDIVYVYSSFPDSSILYKTIVIETNIKEDQLQDDSQYFAHNEDFWKSYTKPHVRLKLLSNRTNKDLSLKELQLNGLGKNCHPQGQMGVPSKLKDYLANSFL